MNLWFVDGHMVKLTLGRASVKPGDSHANQLIRKLIMRIGHGPLKLAVHVQTEPMIHTCHRENACSHAAIDSARTAIGKPEIAFVSEKSINVQHAYLCGWWKLFKDSIQKPVHVSFHHACIQAVCCSSGGYRMSLLFRK